MIVAGVMSGTSADGVDVAIVRLTGKRFRTRFELLSHCAFPYPAAVREAVLAAMNAPSIAVSELARLNFLLAEFYADCVRRTQRQSDVVCELIACHGQTIYHQGKATKYLGRNIACTWQIGDGSVLATRLGIPVVSDFRPADMAAGGLGAPLVPFLDMLVFRHPRRGRIVQNIGGIANLTAIPAAAQPENLRAFDTGPGNMVIDAVCEKLFGKAFDDKGKLAAKGTVLGEVLAERLRHPFFRRTGPRTAGREEFGREYVSEFLASCGQADKHDILATATALTARSIGQAVRSLSKNNRYHDLFVSGGGTRNNTLMEMIRGEVAELAVDVLTTDSAGVPSQAKEAVAFAVLGYQTWHRQPSNVPGATGAGREVILGKVSYA
ncbi:MAG: anhydro-N-acetylmuramic acid kinase [Acidobacteria bacterium]|nr:MAG: anhydro-N-acetylmuramic acid kinase [Acidobacteriota bacterium]